jgi:hypothetical protein
MPAINFQAIVSGRNQEPYVQILLDDKMAELTPDEARSFALQLLIAAESAIGDAFLVHFMGSIAEQPSEHAVMLLRAFRDYRSDLRAKSDPLQWGEGGEWPGEKP